MGRKCCVPFCKTNYQNGQTASAFMFPAEEKRREQWLKCINRENFVPSKFSAVCIKHFEKKFLVTQNRTFGPDGSLIIVPRIRPKLTKNAKPTIFETPQNIKIISTFSKRKKQFKTLSDKELKDKIASFEKFKDNFKGRIDSNWLHSVKEDSLYFFKLHYEEVPKIIVAIKINKDLEITVWYNDTELPPEIFESIFEDDFLCDSWTKFESLISHLNTYDNPEATIQEKITKSLCHTISITGLLLKKV